MGESLDEMKGNTIINEPIYKAHSLNYSLDLNTKLNIDLLLNHENKQKEIKNKYLHIKKLPGVH